MSDYFIWSDKYSVKVDSIDLQHKKFFELTNQILDVLDNPNYYNFEDSKVDLKEQLVKLVVELGKYAQLHFNYEEKCLKESKCDGCDGHTYIHDIYRAKIINYLKQITAPDVDIYSLAREIADFSRDWLSTHILRKDREYISCLVASGVK